MNQSVKILLTFTGFQDPYSLGLVGDEEQSGPILSLLSARIFDRIVLISTPRTVNNTGQTLKALNDLYPEIIVDILDLPLEDPTDYASIMKGLRSIVKKTKAIMPDAEYSISLSSGTPQMHACWLLLAACGDIPATLLNIRPQKYITGKRPLVNEVELTSDEFPDIRTRVCEIESIYSPTQDSRTIIEEIGIVGDHPKMRQALEVCSTLADSDAPILIIGETGTGKELFAKFIHLMSGHSPESFIPINCAAIPPELVESMLFGHKKGSFTGAINDQLGKFDQADGGTLFLDELGELPLMNTQAVISMWL
ncbi:MAG: RNA repair transcriptional activator RtcR family protein [Desulfobacteraceae bacterium]|jgi:sigma54-dependent transcription regulator